MSRISEETPIIELVNEEGSTANYLGLKSGVEQKKRSIFPWKRSPWISEATNPRTKIKREAYLAIFKDLSSSQYTAVQKKNLNHVLAELNAGVRNPLEGAYQALCEVNQNCKKLNDDLQSQDRLEFAQFVKTLSDAQPYGMVGSGEGRNADLAEIITLFTDLYEQNPQNNPLLYGFPTQTPEEVLVSTLDPTVYDIHAKGTYGAIARRRAVEGYMEKIETEIQRLIDMSPQELGMTFSDDDVKHVAIVRKLKSAYNRLATEIDHNKRYVNIPTYQFQIDDYRFTKVDKLPDQCEKGVLYIMESGRYAVRDPKGIRQEGDLHLDQLNGVTLQEFLKKPKEHTAFKEAILTKTSKVGHTIPGEKSDTYRLEDYNPNTEYEHEKIQSKISMRGKKRGILATSIIFAAIITLGQVAIAVFTASGVFAVLIGISCGVTNVFLFTRDIRGLFLSVIKGDLFRGMNWTSGSVLGLWFLASLATGVVAGGLVMMSLVSLFGFVISTAPAWLAIVAGAIAALTVIGMTSMFFQVGAGIVKSLRGHSVGSLFKSLKEGIVGFFTPPAFNKDVQDLKEQVLAYKAALAPLKRELRTLYRQGGARDQAEYYRVLAQVEALREQYYPIRARLRRENFAHYARFGLKLFFSLLIAPLAFVAAFFTTYAYSILSVGGTADSFKLFLGFGDKLALGVSNAFTAISGVVNGVLSSKNLFSVGLTFAGKFSKITVGILYGVGTFFNLIYHGKLWQTFKNAVGAFRANPYKTIIPSLRMGVAVALGAAIVLNGYGNGATAGGGAIRTLPTWLVDWMKPETFTIILATASSMALTKGATDDAGKSATPMLELENPNPIIPKEPILLPGSAVLPVAGQKRDHETAFFDREDAFFNVKLRPGANKKRMGVDEGASRQENSSEYASDDNSSDSGFDTGTVEFTN